VSSRGRHADTASTRPLRADDRAAPRGEGTFPADVRIYHSATNAMPRWQPPQSVRHDLAILKWSASYSVGVAVLDAEHKHLLDLLNQLYDSIIDGSVNNATTSRILDQVLDFAIKHCEHEERMLVEAGYPGISDLKQQHEHLREKIEEFHRKLAGQGSISNELANFLMEWILGHILKEDRKGGVFLNAAGIH
jgi:hemerythrin